MLTWLVTGAPLFDYNPVRSWVAANLSVWYFSSQLVWHNWAVKYCRASLVFVDLSLLKCCGLVTRFTRLISYRTWLAWLIIYLLISVRFGLKKILKGQNLFVVIRRQFLGLGPVPEEQNCTLGDCSQHSRWVKGARRVAQSYFVDLYASVRLKYYRWVSLNV
jgi:hypothetical protein